MNIIKGDRLLDPLSKDTTTGKEEGKDQKQANAAFHSESTSVSKAGKVTVNVVP